MKVGEITGGPAEEGQNVVSATWRAKSEVVGESEKHSHQRQTKGVARAAVARRRWVQSSRCAAQEQR